MLQNNQKRWQKKYYSEIYTFVVEFTNKKITEFLHGTEMSRGSDKWPNLKWTVNLTYNQWQQQR